MREELSITLIALMFACLVAAMVFRFFKNRNVAQILELCCIGFFIAYTSQYSYLFGYIRHLDLHDWINLILFVFSIFLGVYKIIFFIKYK